jgi:hypothetical protein
MVAGGRLVGFPLAARKPACVVTETAPVRRLCTHTMLSSELPSGREGDLNVALCQPA